MSQVFLAIQFDQTDESIQDEVLHAFLCRDDADKFVEEKKKEKIRYVEAGLKLQRYMDKWEESHARPEYPTFNPRDHSDESWENYKRAIDHWYFIDEPWLQAKREEERLFLTQPEFNWLSLDKHDDMLTADFCVLSVPLN